MPWNDYFNNVLGGAAGGMFRAGRGASLAEILAGAAMGSTAAMEYEDEKARRLQEIEERRAQEEEDRKMRMEDREMRLKAERDRLASIAREEEAGRTRDALSREFFDPDFVGPERRDLPSEAFAQPGDRFAFEEKRSIAEADAENDAAKQQEAISFLLEHGIQPSQDPAMNLKLYRDLFSDQGKPDFTPEQLYQHGRDAQQDQEEEDDAWREQFTDDLNASRFDKREGPAIKAWDEAFKRNLTLVKGNDSTKGLAPDDLIEEAKRLTDEEVGFNKGGLVGSSMPNLGRPKAPPINKQPLPDTLTGLRPSGSPVASPTGAQAPPSVSGNRTKVDSSQIGSAIDQAIPNLPPQLKGQAKVMIYQELQRVPREQRAERLQQLLQELAQDAQGLQF